jgi:hypothetical protein
MVRFMNLEIRQVMRQLALDLQKVRQALNILAQDDAARIRLSWQINMKDLIKHVTWLKLDVGLAILMWTDSVSDGQQYREDRGWAALDSLHWSYAVLITFLNDLKKAKKNLNETYIYPYEIEELIIDWRRFQKTIGPIQEFLSTGANSQIGQNFLPMDEEEKTQLFQPVTSQSIS